jgi:hypothetical protein
MASTRRIIRKAVLEVLQSEKATFDQRIKAARMLTKVLGLAKPGNFRGSHGAKKNVQEREASENTIDAILSKIEPD